ncbi:MAG: ComF family protein [Clostridia bacterium]|nr:ComF family protein [Clostridia bacterium]MBP3650508.1 ComF family protein [Clostridia bacterium]
MRQSLTDGLLNLLFPWDNQCALCARTLIAPEHVLCCHCQARLDKCLLTAPERVSTHEPLALCVSAFSFEQEARTLIHQLKYSSNASTALILGLHMCAALLDSPAIRDWDAVVPVPLHPSKLRFRGYNQAQLLAREIASYYGFSMRPGLLKRIKATKSQTKRTATERLAAMQGVFEATAEAQGLSILLVDDVLTTGATATACAEALLRAGARAVTLITACQA